MSYFAGILTRSFASPMAAAAAPSSPATTAGHLRVDQVHKSFGPTHVLRDVSLAVAAGEFVTLLGPSGCGKTTLLRIIAGLEVPDSGSVRLGDLDLLPLPANRRPVNTVFQSYALFPHLNVFANVAFGLRARGLPEREIKTRVGAALDMLRLAQHAGRHTHALSGGEKQRVALARALVNEPQLLLLDEPMSALDAKLRADVQVELRRLQRRLGTTFLLVTHDQDEAMTVSDRIFVMERGRIDQHGPPAEVYEHPTTRFVAEFLGAANLIAVTRRDAHAAESPLGTLAVAQPLDPAVATLAIRPERIRVHAAPPPVNALQAPVREIIYRGDHHDLFIDAPVPLRVRMASAATIQVGQTIWLELPPEHLEPLRD